MSEFNINEVYELLANGGNLINHCKDNDIKYSDIMSWIYDDADREKRYNQALNARGEYTIQKILGELDDISFADIRCLYSEEGNLLPPNKWPDHAAKMVSSLETTAARHDSDGNEISPEVKKLKVIDKLRAIEMIGKNLRMFVDRHEVTGKLTLEELVMSSIPKDNKDTQTTDEKKEDDNDPTLKKETKENKNDSDETT